MLPQKFYEALRWIVSAVIPATCTFLGTLAQAWEWGLPTEAIVITLNAVGVLLGAIFLGSKYINDHQNKE